MQPADILKHITEIQLSMDEHIPHSVKEYDALRSKVETVRNEMNRFRKMAESEPNETVMMRQISIINELENEMQTLSIRVKELGDRIHSKPDILPSRVSTHGYLPERADLARLLEETEQTMSKVGESGWQTVQASRGVTLEEQPTSANPVALLVKDHHMPLEPFKKKMKKGVESRLNTLIKAPSSPPVLKKHIEELKSFFNKTIYAKYFSYLANEFLKNQSDAHFNVDKIPYDHDEFMRFIDVFMEKAISDAPTPDRNFVFTKMKQNFLTVVQNKSPKTISDHAKQFKDLLKGKKGTQLEEKVVRYDIREIRECVLKELEGKLRKQFHKEELEQHMTAMHLLLSQPKVHFGNYMSPQETKTFLKDVKEALKTTYDIDFSTQDILKDAHQSINVSNLYQMWKFDSKMKAAFKALPEFHPEEIGAVAKGGSETSREPTMIGLITAFGLENTVLMKDVFVDANIEVEGALIQTAVVAPFIPGIEETDFAKQTDVLFSTYTSTAIVQDPESYKRELEKFQAILSPDSYAESLVTSLITHATDDHFKQFTVKDGRLINYDTGRNLPPARFAYNNGSLEIMLRSVLIDLPQFEDKLPESVLSKIQKITPERIEEQLRDKCISEFRDPYETRKLLKKIQHNPPTDVNTQNKIAVTMSQIGNRQAERALLEYFKSSPKDPSIFHHLLESAERGCHYQRNVAIYHLKMYRDFHEMNLLENSELQKELKDLLKNSDFSLTEALTSLKNFDFKGIERLMVVIKKNERDVAKLEYLLASIQRHISIKEYLDDIGVTFKEALKTIPHFDDEGRAKIDDQIEKLTKASVDENAIERMKEGQRKLIAKIKEKESLTGRELAETLYPEEMLFYDARRDCGFVLPSYSGGIGYGSINKFMDYVENNRPFDEARILQLRAARDKMYREACDIREFKRYCTDSPIL